jgi:hypothetical protein
MDDNASARTELGDDGADHVCKLSGFACRIVRLRTAIEILELHRPQNPER